MKPKTGERAALVLLIAYCLDLAWKLAHWSELTKGLDWWMIAMALLMLHKECNRLAQKRRQFGLHDASAQFVS